MFVNCDNHSLRPVGVYAARQDTEMVSFFGTINLYNFFSRSTQRWKKLKDAVPLVLKAEAETRWSSRIEAAKPIKLYLEKIVLLLESIVENDSQTIDTQSKVTEIYNLQTDANISVLKFLLSPTSVRLVLLTVAIDQGFPNFLFMGTLWTIIDSLVYPQNFLIFLAAKLNLL